MLSSVFCSSISCGWICMSKRREISNRRSSTCAEGDVLERLVEDRLAHGAHRRLHLVDARAGGHPAGLHVQLRDAPVVAVEHREEILRQIVLVARIERADDAEVDRRVARLLRIVDQHEDVAGMHVGVEEVVAEHLREEDLARRSRPAARCRCRAACRRARSLIGTPWMRSMTMTSVRQQVPVHLRHVQQRGAGEIALQLRGVGRLAHQVQLIEDGLLVLAHHLDAAAAAVPRASSAPRAPRARTAPRGRARCCARMPGRSTLTTTSRPSLQRAPRAPARSRRPPAASRRSSANSSPSGRP